MSIGTTEFGKAVSDQQDIIRSIEGMKDRFQVFIIPGRQYKYFIRSSLPVTPDEDLSSALRSRVTGETINFVTEFNCKNCIAKNLSCELNSLIHGMQNTADLKQTNIKLAQGLSQPGKGISIKLGSPGNSLSWRDGFVETNEVIFNDYAVLAINNSEYQSKAALAKNLDSFHKNKIEVFEKHKKLLNTQCPNVQTGRRLNAQRSRPNE
jgi:hypothetical protein